MATGDKLITLDELKLVYDTINGNVVNNLTTTSAGKMLDARQGKALDDAKLPRDFSGLTEASSVSSSDLLAVDTGSVTKKLAVSTLQNQVLSDVYSKSQVDSIVAQSTAAFTWIDGGSISNKDFNALKTTARYRVGNITQFSNAPTGVGYSGTIEIEAVFSYIRQTVYCDSGTAYRFSYDSGSTWSAWQSPAPVEFTLTSMDSNKFAVVDSACYKIGNMAIVNISFNVLTAPTSTEHMFTGLPIPKKDTIGACSNANGSIVITGDKLRNNWGAFNANTRYYLNMVYATA